MKYKVELRFRVYRKSGSYLYQADEISSVFRKVANPKSHARMSSGVRISIKDPNHFTSKVINLL